MDRDILCEVRKRNVISRALNVFVHQPGKVSLGLVGLSMAGCLWTGISETFRLGETAVGIGYALAQWPLCAIPAAVAIPAVIRRIARREKMIFRRKQKLHF